MKGNQKRLRGPTARGNLTPTKLNHQYAENNISPSFYYLSIDRQGKINGTVKKIGFSLNNNSFLTCGTFYLTSVQRSQYFISADKL